MNRKFSAEKPLACALHALSRLRTFLSRLHWLLVLTAVLLLVLIWGSVAWESQRIRQTQIHDQRTEMLHLGEVLNEMLLQQVESLDNALLILRAEYLDHPADLLRMIELLRRDPLKGLEVHVTVIGRDGYTTYSDIVKNAKPVYLGDRAHFRHFANGGADELYISKPVLGRMMKKWGMTLSRPLFDKKGTFLGVMAIFMPPEQLISLSHSLDSHTDTHITLASDDGTVLASSHNSVHATGTRLSETQLNAFRLATAGVDLDAWIESPKARVLAHRWMKQYPLLLLISHTTQAIDADFSVRQRQLIIFGSIASLISVAVLILLGRSLQQRKNVENRLKREHANLAEAQRIARLGSWDMDLRTASLLWSGQTTFILGHEPAAMPKNLDEYLQRVHEDDRDVVRRAYEASLTGVGSGNIVHRIRTADQVVKWVRVRWVVSFDEFGQPVRTSGTLQDITERRLEQALAETVSRERLLILDSTAEGIYGLDLQGRCTFINQSATRMLGYQAEELIGKVLQPLIQAGENMIDSVLTGKISHGQEDVVFRCKDGSSIPVELSAHPMRDADKVMGLVVTFSDISKRKLADVELRIAEKAFQTQEGMFVTDENGVILRINKAFTEITGFSATDIVGKNPRLRSSGKHDSAFYTAMWERIKATGAWKGEIWNRRKNGDIYPESVTITAVKGDGGDVTHYVATMHDISVRKAAEEKIRDLAFYDPLTRLPNRRLFEDRMHQALANSERSRHMGALMFIDLDKFKALNDSLGHDIGDLLLQQVAQRLLDSVRESDTVARLGGDEFVVLLVNLHAQRHEALSQCEWVGRKILEALNQIYILNGHRHHSTPSIGVSLFSGPGVSADVLLKQADLAMYQAKAAGRNTLRFYSPDSMETSDAVTPDDNSISSDVPAVNS